MSAGADGKDTARAPTATRPPSTLLALVAAFVPGLLALACALVVAAETFDVENVGTSETRVAFVSMLVLLLLSGALALGARWRWPRPWALLFVPTWPMLFASGLLVYGAIEDVAPKVREGSYAIRSEIADLLAARAIGCITSAVLLAFMSVGMGVAALARRAPGRRVGAGCGLGCLSVLPLVALVVWRALPLPEDVESIRLVPIPFAVFALAAIPLAVAGIGRDADGRSVAFALASAVSVLLAFSAIGTAVWWMTAADAMRASYGDGWRDLADAAEGVGVLRTRALVLAAVALVPVAVAGWWGRRRRREGTLGPDEHRLGPIAQAAPALVVLGVFAFDSITLSVAEHIVADARPSAEASLPSDVELPSPGRPGRASAPFVIATTEATTVVENGARAPNDALATAAGRAPIAAAIRTKLGPSPPTMTGAERTIDVAIDRRVGGASLRGLVAAAVEGTADSLYFGRSSPPPDHVASLVRRGLPLALALLRTRAEGVSGHLFAAIDASSIADQPGWQATIRPGGIRIAPRAGSTVLPFDVFPERWSEGRDVPVSPPQLLIATRRRPVVRLAIADDADAELVVATLRWLDELGADGALVADPPR